MMLTTVPLVSPEFGAVQVRIPSLTNAEPFHELSVNLMTCEAGISFKRTNENLSVSVFIWIIAISPASNCSNGVAVTVIP